MYATQPLLPDLRAEFHTGEAAVGATISVLTFACALAAPFVGPLADAIGRKRVIVSAILGLALVTFAAAGATTLHALLVWRFVQGLFMPAVFAVTLAYIAEEFPAEVGGRAVGAYIAGNVFGGFLGRYVAALVASRWDWHVAFIVLGVLNLVGGAIVLSRCRARRASRSSRPRARRCSRWAGLRAIPSCSRRTPSAAACCSRWSRRSRSRRTISRRRRSVSAPSRSATCSSCISSASSRRRSPDGSSTASATAPHCCSRVATSALGVLVTLIPAVAAIVIGLGVMSTGVFASQASSQGYIGVIVHERRSTAAALYLTVYYTAGGLGAVLPAIVWSRGGWPATVALVLAVQVIAATVAAVLWTRRGSAAAVELPSA